MILALAAWRRRSLLHIAAAAACLSSAMLGQTVAVMIETAVQLMRTLVIWLDAVVPQTRRTWGIISIAAAFTLLAAGAAMSLLRSRPTDRVTGT